jgi:hypothetical protein
MSAQLPPPEWLPNLRECGKPVGCQPFGSYPSRAVMLQRLVPLPSLMRTCLRNTFTLVMREEVGHAAGLREGYRDIPEGLCVLVAGAKLPIQAVLHRSSSAVPQLLLPLQKHLFLAGAKLLNRLLQRKDLQARRRGGFWRMRARAGRPHPLLCLAV